MLPTQRTHATGASDPTTGVATGTEPAVLMRRRGDLLQVTPDIACLTTGIANCYFLGVRSERWSWVLVDTGVPGSRDRIMQVAENHFGPRAHPECIILTHGHFDHVGAVVELARKWNLQVYAHELEMPYLTGQSDYPPPDPSVGGGIMARMSRWFPRAPVDLGNRVRPLPADGSVPGLPNWQWLHTPGHAPGHVSLFRASDRALVVGDAFVTTKQESAYAVMTQQQKVHGPPAYWTIDWNAAKESVRRLASLRPSIAATGHGIPMHGSRLECELVDLARNFDRKAIPRHGRYVEEPAVTDRQGVVYLPPRRLDVVPLAIGAASVLAGGVALARWAQRRNRGA